MMGQCVLLARFNFLPEQLGSRTGHMNLWGKSMEKTDRFHVQSAILDPISVDCQDAFSRLEIQMCHKTLI